MTRTRRVVVDLAKVGLPVALIQPPGPLMGIQRAEALVFLISVFTSSKL
jgi:hypothetical protein